MRVTCVCASACVYVCACVHAHLTSEIPPHSSSLSLPLSPVLSLRLSVSLSLSLAACAHTHLSGAEEGIGLARHVATSITRQGWCATEVFAAPPVTIASIRPLALRQRRAPARQAARCRMMLIALRSTWEARESAAPGHALTGAIPANTTITKSFRAACGYVGFPQTLPQE